VLSSPHIFHDIFFYLALAERGLMEPGPSGLGIRGEALPLQLTIGCGALDTTEVESVELLSKTT
jgi:hypothetical protein